MRTQFLILGLALLLGSTSFASGPDKDLERLVSYMAGSFSSNAQSVKDTAFFDISLKMAPIWKGKTKTDGYWLYVEQAMASRLERPYRQRVYHVHRNAAGKLVSEVFELNKPLRFAGQYKEKEPLATLSTDSLIPRSGCEIVLEVQGDNFVGKTGDKTCPSNLRGASFATSEVTITPDKLLSWDRGWDATGKQVWGAEKGGYEFIKQK
jgi:hypothetical protein